MSVLPLDARAPLETLLARALLDAPDAELHAALRQPEVKPLLAELDPGLGPWLDAPWTPEASELAREEFARLFLLPGGTPPFASAWLEGERERLGAQIVTFVRGVMAALGRESTRREPWGNLPLDHLGLLLELAAHSAVSPDPGPRLIGERLRSELLGPWVASFGGALSEAAQLPLYRAVGRLLAGLFGARAPHEGNRS